MIKNIEGFPPQQDGVLVLNKPKGPSSAACVGMIKRRLGQKKIGHAGTLDPMATGVLLILLGQATKISGYLMGGGKKIYSGLIKFGMSTDTWDAEGKVTAMAAPELTAAVTEEILQSAFDGMVGVSRQEVPPYSAAKHQGRPLYALARKGIETPVKTKTVEISRAELEWFKPPLARFRVACSSGTYIRSLAHSLGIRFGCGATLMELTREYSHPFGLEDSVDLDELSENPALLEQKVHSLNKALPHVPAIALNANLCRRVKNGNPVAAGLLPPLEASIALFVDENGTPLALAEKSLDSGQPLWIIGRGLWNN